MSPLGVVPAKPGSKESSITRLLVGSQADEVVEMRVKRPLPVPKFNRTNNEGQVGSLNRSPVRQIVSVSGVGANDLPEGPYQLSIGVDPGATDQAELECSVVGDAVFDGDLVKCDSSRPRL